MLGPQALNIIRIRLSCIKWTLSRLELLDLNCIIDISLVLSEYYPDRDNNLQI